jgi:hypothetical protein
MPVPTSNIRLSADIAVELQFAPSSIMKITDVFGTSQLAGTVSSGSFHNIYMGPGAAATFKTLIYLPYGATADMKLGSWASYDHSFKNIVTFSVANNSANAYEVKLYLSDTPSTFQHLFYNKSFGQFGADNVNEVDWDTMQDALLFSGVTGAAYYIDCEINHTRGGANGVYMSITSASDTDGVGAGQARTDYTTSSGAWLLSPDPSGADFSNLLISGPSTSVGIPWNKRTSWDMVIA